MHKRKIFSAKEKKHLNTVSEKCIICRQRASKYQVFGNYHIFSRTQFSFFLIVCSSITFREVHKPQSDNSMDFSQSELTHVTSDLLKKQNVTRTPEISTCNISVITQYSKGNYFPDL